MIMMRSTPTTKMAKPPPPVPPRPNKTLVAEALAKTRKILPDTQKNTPVRIAPPPPINEINRSKSTVNVQVEKPIFERSISDEVKCNTRTVIFQSPKIEKKKDDEGWDKILNDRNHVNTLIDEMFASVLEVSTEEENKVIINTNVANSPTVVIVEDNNSNSSTELESMRIEDEKILKRQRLPSKEICDSDVSKIQHSDWVEVSDGQEVRLSSCQITIEDLQNKDKNRLKLDYERIEKMSSLHGLPPLPKSLSGFNLLDSQKPPTPVRTTSMRGQLVYPPHPKLNGTTETSRKSTNLDTQLAILRREMYSLRQLDLSLLSQLWSLNESIQDFRQILQEQEDRVLSPPSPSPTPSSGDEGDPDEFYMSTNSMNFRTPPPPVPVRRPSSSSNASSLG